MLVKAQSTLVKVLLVLTASLRGIGMEYFVKEPE